MAGWNTDFKKIHGHATCKYSKNYWITKKVSHITLPSARNIIAIHSVDNHNRSTSMTGNYNSLNAFYNSFIKNAFLRLLET